MESMFWMGGRLATELEYVTTDLAALKDSGFWAVVGSFEGQWKLAKFRSVIEAPLPIAGNWQPIPISSWCSSKDELAYRTYVDAIKEEIAIGNVYQVNACRVLSAQNEKNSSLLPLANLLQRANPAPFSSYLSLPGIEIASASPERFLSLSGRTLITSPIKGTSATSEFLEKDHAENLMIVDLMRNDLGAVARSGSMSTPRLLDTEQHPGLFHLVSDVQAEIAEGLEVCDVLNSVMPPGSVSGAPKSSALSLISSNEGFREIYCGVVGWVEGNRAELAVAIRTFWQNKDGALKFGTGAGITWGSDAQLEWEETELKAGRLIGIASGQVE